MTRIAGGRWRGRRLVTPAGSVTRPTGEKVRAAIANTLVAAGAVEGATVLDLYAGSGALGLELASRGAASVLLVERDRAAQAAIRSNIAALRARDCALLPGDVASFAGLPQITFDIVVADPPYGADPATLADALTRLHAAGRLRPGAELVIERAARDGEVDWPAPLRSVRARRYGDTLVCYGRAP